MILHRLLAALFDNGVGFVTTSNFRPDELYPNGLHRDRILPAIELLKEKLEVVNVDAGIDYRAPHAGAGEAVPHAARAGRPTRRWTRPSTRLAESRDEDPVLHIEHREIRARRKAGGVVWFDFRTLVRRPALAERLPGDSRRSSTPCCCRDVPQMPPRMASEARRFTWLVDVLYDRRVKLIMSAAVPPEALYTEGPLAHEFPRTVSRLNEMQSAEFLALARRDGGYLA